MKLVFGRSSRGTPIPRVLNPIVFCGVALCLVFGAVAIAAGAVFMGLFAVFALLYAPFSFFSTVRITEK